MHVSVVIVGYRNPGDIVRCLAALASSSHEDFKIVVVENGGPAAFEALAAAVPTRLSGGQAVRLIPAHDNPGFAGGVNLGLAASPDADAWWVLNPDTEPHSDAMARYVARMATGDCDAVGGTLYLPDGRVQSHGGVWQPWLARAVSIGHGSPLAVKPVPAIIEARQTYLNGASMMVSGRFIEVCGPMSEHYFLYCEEVEWCLRAARRGLRLGFAADALVLHHQGTTTGNDADVRDRGWLPVYLNARNTVLLTRECFPGLAPVALLANLALIVLKFGKRRAWRQMGYAFAGWRAGLAGEHGPPSTSPRRTDEVMV
jgi:GT2 family glycosyltransferase